MLLPLQCMQTCPLCYSDLPLVGLVIELVWVGLRVVVTVVVESTMVVDSAVGMEWMEDMKNFVAEMAWMVDIVDMKMVVGIVAGIVDIAEVVDSHNHILSNLVQVVVDIVVEAKLAMGFEESKYFEVDRGNFAEGIVVEFVEAS